MAIGNKAQGKQGLMWAAVLVVGFILLSQAGVLPKIGGGTATTTTTGTTTVGSNVLQTTVSDVTAYFDSYNKYARNSEITNGNHRVFLCSKADDCATYPKNYVDKGFLAEGGSVKCSPGDKGKAFFGLNSTTHYPVAVDFTCPLTEGVLNVKAGLAAYDSTPTITIFRDIGDVLTSSAVQAIGSSDTRTLGVRLEVTSQQAFGDVDHPGAGNALCVQYNGTCFNSFKLDGRSVLSTPKARADVAVTGNTVRCYDWTPVGNSVESATDGIWTGSLVVQGGSVDPGTTDQCSNVSIFVYDTTLDLDADNLNLIAAVEDEDGNDIGMTGLHANTTLYFS